MNLHIMQGTLHQNKKTMDKQAEKSIQISKGIYCLSNSSIFILANIPLKYKHIIMK